MQRRSVNVFCISICASLLSSTALATAQSYPDRPVRVILAGSPGSSIDTVARIIAPAISQALGQPVVLENVDGAGGTVGAMQVSQASKDGYTIGIVSANFAISPSLYASLPYDSLEDIAPVTLLTSGVLVLAVNPNEMPVTSVAEMVDAANAASRPLQFGSPGVGSAIHLAFEMFADMTGTEWLHIPYRGTSQFMTSLISGEVAAGVVTGTGGKAYFDTGQLVPIGITTRVRNTILPDVAPLHEVGVPEYELNSWLGMIAPSGIPDEIMATINDAAVQALADPETKERLENLGYNLLPMTPDEAAAAVAEDIERFSTLIGSLNITPQN